VNSKTPSIHLLSDGIIKYDGGSVFGQIPKVLWEQQVKPDRWNRVSLGLNCLLIRTEHGNVLVDTGVGNKETGRLREVYGLSSSKLGKGLREVGLAPKDIDKVILTHLHFDHSGGCTKIDRSGRPIPVFPKATYIVQASCWENAMAPSERGESAHHSEDFACLQETGQLSLVDGDAEILPGIWVKDTGGHCVGHQVVHISCGGEKVVFLGDVIPTPHHLALPYIAAHDQYPEDTLERKKELVAQAVKEGWLVIFGHGSEERAGYLEKRDGCVSLRPVNL
jgi:glyoxylase-like metal-dependent hydrolase (beta-lactamase superfamily II)